LKKKYHLTHLRLFNLIIIVLPLTTTLLHMKSRVFLFAAAVLMAVMTLGTSSNVFAQARPYNADDAITIDALGLLDVHLGNKTLKAQNFWLQYEHKLEQESSIAGRFVFFNDIGDATLIGFGGTYRFYIANSRALTGMSVGPGLDALFLSVGDQSYTAFGVGGDFSYKWIFGGFVAEPSFMLRQFFAGSEGVSSSVGLYWRIRANLGYAW
jgi:hypothetical protein